ncbi:DNA repair protein RecO [Basilea psittacipulmonis]|uniref:DNA repair protein RecO n=1 Tax=Basilea psittacipulmonis DSM 24701 TaxID=1072685 RepID=A0A077DIE1_9BURK|nr:DNA repair protein RecO [Basilea psittacipulmonis]AIL33237.1 hypothetical protein IX83_07965 [Basilea psittacipulmonis DSM 24701]
MSKKQHTHDIGFMLHAIAWKERSVIANVFTKESGLVTIVAKGAKQAYSVYHDILHSFTPLHISWKGTSELHTLLSVKTAGFIPIDTANLMSAWYCNELILRLLAKEDPHANLFEYYTNTLQLLAEGKNNQALRYFEWHLLTEIGYGFADNEPDFSDEHQVFLWRPVLKNRLDQVLENTLLRTKEVQLQVNQIKRSI